MSERGLDWYVRQAASKPINRRSFMAASGLTASSAFLMACGAGAGPKELLTYNWSEYVAPENIKEWEKRTGAKYSEDTFASNEELIAKLQAAGGNPGYDICCPTGEYVPGMVEEGWLEKLDLSKIPNFQYINAAYKNTAWDPNNEYLISKDLGTTGIMYRGKLLPEGVHSWQQFYELTKGSESGKVVFVDSMGDVFPFPLKMLGYSINDNEPAHLTEAGDILMELAPHLLALDSDNYDDKLASEEASMVLGWSGPLVDLKLNPDTADSVYTEADEGGLYWMDTWVLLKDPPNKDLAHNWLNFIHEPAIQAQETISNGYATANDEAKKLLPDDVRNNPAIFPREEVVAKLEPGVDHSGVQQRQDIWAEFKANIGS